jgi:hypothetical protein
MARPGITVMHFGEAQAHCDGKPEFIIDLFFHVRRNRLVRGAQRPSHPRDIGKSLVNGILLDLIGESPHDAEHAPGKEAVRLIIGRKNDKAWANLFCLMQRNASFDAYLFCGIAGAGNNAPFSAGDDRFSFQLRMDRFLAGREEGVAIDMDNGLGPGIQAE